jgi:hypothetical protein
MADKCYNIFTFFGNELVGLQVQNWHAALKKAHKPTEDTPFSPKALFDVFLPNEPIDALGWFGQKWIYPDFGSEISLSDGELGFVSAWGAPDGLQDLLLETLFEIDNSVVILNTYTSAEYIDAVRYSAIDSNGDIQFEDCYLQMIDEDDQELGFDYQLFYEHQVDCVAGLIKSVPAIKKTLAKELRRVDKQFLATFKK